MKNFWIFCVDPKAARRLLILSLVALMALPVTAASKKRIKPEDLTNFFLSPEYSQWLVGPIFHIIAEADRKRYLALQTDAEAQAFIKAFWDARGGEAIFPTKGQKIIYDERATEADKLFGEGTNRGRRTDRGTVHVLYGEPKEIRYDPPARQFGSPIEVWLYPSDAPAGLDGRRPERIYMFERKDDQTVFVRGPVRRPR